MSRISRIARTAVPAWGIEAIRRGLEKLDPFVSLAYSQDAEDMIPRPHFVTHDEFVISKVDEVVDISLLQESRRLFLESSRPRSKTQCANK